MKVVVPRLLKNQLVCVDGSLLWVTAEEEMKCASQIAFTTSELRTVCDFLSSTASVDDSSKNVYEMLIQRGRASGCPMLFGSLDLEAHLEAFCLLDYGAQKSLVEDILLLCRGNKKSKPVNMKGIGGLKMAGRLRPARASVPDDFVIIDQSVTGMFERKTRVGL